MTDIVRRLQIDNQTTVVIFKSDVPKFFLNHLDPAILTIDNAVENFAMLMYNISVLPQITIGAVEGRARNAGNELLMAVDMRFAVKHDVLLGQFEVGLGTFPGGGGSQQLHRLIGRGRAMEYILTSKDITPQEAEKIGWINKAFDSSQDMYQYISEITSRLTLFPRGGVLAAKAAINYRANPLRADYERDVGFFGPLLANPDFPQILSKATALTKNFTASEAELNFGEDVVQIYE
ncbi:hypothetical protein ACHAPG_011611 [Botrytis cinerea]